MLVTLCYKSNRFSTESKSEENPVQLEKRFYEDVYPPKTSTEAVPVAKNIAYATVNPPTTSTVEVPVAQNIAYALPTTSTVKIPMAKNIAYATVNH